jgi:hypothetical protein
MQSVLAPHVLAKEPDWPTLGELARRTRELISNPQIQTDAARVSAYWMRSLREAWDCGYHGTLNAWKQFVEQRAGEGQAGAVQDLAGHPTRLSLAQRLGVR